MLNASIAKKIFEFGAGMLYKPIGYVSEIPQWARLKDDAKEGKKWWEFWK